MEYRIDFSFFYWSTLEQYLFTVAKVIMTKTNSEIFSIPFHRPQRSRIRIICLVYIILYLVNLERSHPKDTWQPNVLFSTFCVYWHVVQGCCVLFFLRMMCIIIMRCFFQSLPAYVRSHDQSSLLIDVRRQQQQKIEKPVNFLFSSMPLE